MAASSAYEKLTGSIASRKKLSAETSIPPVANGRGPYRSERIPEIGPAMRKPIVSGSIRIPAQSGVAAKLTPCYG